MDKPSSWSPAGTASPIQSRISHCGYTPALSSEKSVTLRTIHFPEISLYAINSPSSQSQVLRNGFEFALPQAEEIKLLEASRAAPRFRSNALSVHRFKSDPDSMISRARLHPFFKASNSLRSSQGQPDHSHLASLTVTFAKDFVGSLMACQTITRQVAIVPAHVARRVVGEMLVPHTPM
jgi:hypothetical protein